MFKKPVFNLTGAKVLLTAVALCLIFALPAFSQPQLPWKVISSGGTNATSGTLKLRGTIGQSAASMSAAGSLELNAGFWQNFGTSSGCCVGVRGDIDGNGTHNTILDLNYMVSDIFRGGAPSPCPQEADLSGDGTGSAILDLNFLVSDIFRGGPSAGACL